MAKALHLAKVTGAKLVITKLDRLSRNAAFLLALRDSGVRFVAVDMPEANDLTVEIMALAAQAEREAISRRTKEALVGRQGAWSEARKSERGREFEAGGERWGGAQGGRLGKCHGLCGGSGACSLGHQRARFWPPAAP